MKRALPDTPSVHRPRTTVVTPIAMQMEVVGNPRRGVKRKFSGKASTRGKKLTKRQVNEVKTIMHREQELKYFFYRQTAFQITTTPTVFFNPFDVPQGDTDNTRDGDRLRWAGTLEINLQVVNAIGATGDVYNNVRFVVFQWHPMTTGTPYPATNGSDIFMTGPSGSVDIYSVYNHDTRQCYTILYDRVYNTVGPGNNGVVTGANNPSTNTTSSGVHQLRIPLSKVRKDVQYNAGGLQATNRLGLFYVSDSTLATHPTLAYMSKVFFRDS